MTFRRGPDRREGPAASAAALRMYPVSSGACRISRSSGTLAPLKRALVLPAAALARAESGSEGEGSTPEEEVLLPRDPVNLGRWSGEALAGEGERSGSTTAAARAGVGCAGEGAGAAAGAGGSSCNEISSVKSSCKKHKGARMCAAAALCVIFPQVIWRIAGGLRWRW